MSLNVCPTTTWAARLRAATQLPDYTAGRGAEQNFAAQGGEVCSAPRPAANPDRLVVAALSDGGYVVVGRTFSDTGSDVFMRRFDADGVAREDDILVNADNYGSSLFQVGRPN